MPRQSFKDQVKTAKELVYPNPKNQIADKIPLKANDFYHDLGLLEHPATREPVKDLAVYQSQVWNDAFKYKYQMVIKSQKLGFTTSSLMQDFQFSLLPTTHPLSTKGRQTLLIGQKFDIAKNHLYQLRKLILQSKKYSKYLISGPTEFLLKDEVTKVSTMFIHNNENPKKPSRIIALGPREGGVWSWMEVGRIHMSDIAASNQIDDTGLFGAAFSRLANTNGSFLIETPPRGQRGSVWDIYHKQELEDMARIELSEDQKAARFKIYKIPYREGIASGVFSEEFIAAEMERLGSLFGQYYECEFLNAYTTWYDPDLIHYSNELAGVVEL